MAVNWMDNFNIYGTDAGRLARMLNGVYAGVGGVDLAVDPDPTAGGSRCLKVTDFFAAVRKVIPVPRTTLGAAFRVWCTQLPAANQVWTLVYFQDVAVNDHITIGVDPSGFIKAYRKDTAGLVLLGTSANPVIVANAWLHLEVKVFLDAAVGTVEVRVEGVPVLVVPATRTTTNAAGAAATAQNVTLINAGALGSFVQVYIKDYIIWDNTTAFNNNFMGSCQVYKIVPDADVALNWTPSPADGIGFDKINEVTPDDDTRYIQAPFPLPAAYKCGLGDLPVTVTSVRAVLPIHRSRKTDGGDGNLQIGLISAASTGLGADRPITTAYTYWWDVFDADPNGGIAWTRLAVNALNLQLNRTL